MKTLFTVGHSMHTIETFIRLLKQNQIDVVADVRSQPYSRHFPWFSREPFKQALKDDGIRYVFLGRELGARRDERQCYIGGKVSYDLIARTEAFAAGLKRLEKGIQEYRIALLCAEKDPLDCHRTILVSRHATRFTKVAHIWADGRVESHEDAESRLVARYGINPDDWFRTQEEILAEAYKRRGEEIAYVEVNPTKKK